MEYLRSVIPVIESNYDNLTPVEKNIGDYFIHNKERADFSAKTVAERLFVSEASLSRFAKNAVSADTGILSTSMKKISR